MAEPIAIPGGFFWSAETGRPVLLAWADPKEIPSVMTCRYQCVERQALVAMVKAMRAALAGALVHAPHAKRCSSLRWFRRRPCDCYRRALEESVSAVDKVEGGARAAR